VDVAALGSGKQIDFEVRNIGMYTFNGSVDNGMGAPLSGPFTCLSGCTYSNVALGDVKVVTLRFAPVADSFLSQTVRFTGGGSKTLTVSGTGNLLRSPSVTVTSGSLDFGSMNIGDIPLTAELEVKNAGPGTWKGEVSVAMPFKCSPKDGAGRCIYTIPPGGVTPVTISFDPIKQAIYNDYIGFSGRLNPSIYLPFDKEDVMAGGKSRETSGNKDDATLVNGALITSPSVGKFGEALSLNGTNQYATIPSGAAPTGSRMSVSAWVYPTGYADGTYNGIVSWGPRSCAGHSFLLSLQNNGRPSFASWCNDFVPNSGAAASLNQWNHVVAVLDGKNVTLYMNGVPVSGTLPIAADVWAGVLNIGSTDNPGRLFRGLIDDVEIFNRPLSPTEVAKLALANDRSKTLSDTILARFRALSAEIAEAQGAPESDKIQLSVKGEAIFKPLVNVDLGTFDFGKVIIRKYKDVTFQFTNLGTGTLGPGVVTVPPPFYCIETENIAGVKDSGCGYNVAGGSHFNAKIRFAPTQMRIYTNILDFSWPPSLISIPLQGEGVYPGFKYKEF